MSSAVILRYPGWDVILDMLDAISPKTIEPVAVQTIRMPSMNPKSPMRFVMNAFFAASAAASRSNQWPMSKYEATPTNSQKMNIITKLLASTMPSIANMKKESEAK